jgi:hypothetical protein
MSFSLATALKPMGSPSTLSELSKNGCLTKLGLLTWNYSHSCTYFYSSTTIAHIRDYLSLACPPMNTPTVFGYPNEKCSTFLQPIQYFDILVKSIRQNRCLNLNRFRFLVPRILSYNIKNYLSGPIISGNLLMW